MKYWFKRKRYGYGWTPSTWQGWLVCVVYLVLVVLGALFLGRGGDEPASEDLLVFFTTLIVATATLIVVTYYKGPKPKWRWGATNHDNPKEDN